MSFSCCRCLLGELKANLPTDLHILKKNLATLTKVSFPKPNEQKTKNIKIKLFKL